MDQEKISEKLYQSANLNPIPKCSDHSLETAENDSFLELTLGIQPSNSGSKRRLQDDIDANNAIVARKIQKADREKLRRDKLDEHFQELGNVLDGHKNDKAIIVNDAIRALKDLTSEVSRLQSEHAALHQESNELTLENKELREEKTSLQSDVGALEVQCQQTVSFMFPWAPIDRSVVMAPPFSYPFVLPVPSGPFPMCYPPLQPMPFFGNQSGVTSDPGFTFMPYLTPQFDQPSILSASLSYISNQEDFANGPSRQNRNDDSEKIDGSNDVATDLELKIPGSTSQMETSASNN